MLARTKLSEFRNGPPHHLATLVWGFDAARQWHVSNLHQNENLANFLQDCKDKAHQSARQGANRVKNPMRIQHTETLVQTAQMHIVGRSGRDVHEEIFVPPRRISDTSAMVEGATVIAGWQFFVQ